MPLGNMACAYDYIPQKENVKIYIYMNIKLLINVSVNKVGI